MKRGTIITGNERDLASLARRLEMGGELHEVRADLLTERGDALFELIASHPDTIVFTLREATEGGAYMGHSEEKLTLLTRALTAGAAHIDLELAWLTALPKALRSRLQQHMPKVILSAHLPAFAESRIEEIVGELIHHNAGLSKLAVKVADAWEMVRLGQLTAAMPRTIVIAMGTAGVLSRIAPTRFGMDLTYAPLRPEAATVDAQPTVAQLDQFRRREHQKLTLLGLFGGPQTVHSPGMRVYNSLFSHHNLPWQYATLPLTSAERLPDIMEALFMRGAAITMPLKGAARAFPAATDHWVDETGGANTIVRRGAGFSLYNTDAMAFSELFDTTPGRRVLIFGTGETAKSAFVAARRKHKEVQVTGRHLPEDPALLAHYSPAPSPCDLFINATPRGYMRRETPWDHLIPRGTEGIMDLVMGAEESTLVTWAKTRNLSVTDGFTFWCHQGAIQTSLLTGHPITPHMLKTMGGS